MYIEKIGSLRNLTVMAVFVAIAMFAMVGQGSKTASADHTIGGITVPHNAVRVQICHATTSPTNPFVLITIDVAGLSGHFGPDRGPEHPQTGDFIVAFLGAEGQVVLSVNPITGDCIPTVGAGLVLINVSKVCINPIAGVTQTVAIGTDVRAIACGTGTSFLLRAGVARTLIETPGTGAAAFPAGTTTSIVCTRLVGGSVESSASTREVGLTVGFLTAGSVINCVVTNTFPAPTVTLTVNKVCVGTTAGNFSFTVGGVNRVLTCTGATNTTTFTGVAAGALTLTEVAGTGTDLANFTTGISCVLTGTTTAVGTASTTASIGLTLVGGTNVTCTVTNTRLGTVIVTKVCEPGVTGNFVVTLGTLPSRTLTCGGTTQSTTFTNVALTTTGVTLAEAGRTGLNTAIACADGTTIPVQQAAISTFPVAAGSVTNCFVINFVTQVRPIVVQLVDGRFARFDGNVLNIVDVDVDVDTDVDVDVNNTNTNTNVNTVNPIIQADVHITNVIPTGPGVVGGQQQQQQQQAAVTAGVIAPPRTGDAGLVSENAGGSSTGLLALAIVAVGGTVLVGATLYKRSLS